MGSRLENDAADNAAHKVESELKNPSADKAGDNLRETFLTISAMPAGTQREFLTDLRNDDPQAIEKVKSLLPDLTLGNPNTDATPITMNTDNLDTTQRRALWAAGSIAAGEGFGDSMERNYVRGSEMDKTTSQMVDAINGNLTAVGDMNHAVTLEKAPTGTDPAEVVVRDKGRKEDAIMLH